MYARQIVGSVHPWFMSVVYKTVFQRNIDRKSKTTDLYNL